MPKIFEYFGFIFYLVLSSISILMSMNQFMFM